MKNVYVEITNVCNLNCDFCPSHSRKRQHMTAERFGVVMERLSGRAENLFLHVMGEPLLHPQLKQILQTVDGTDMRLKITTNGTLLQKALPLLIECKNLHTVSISLHSFEANVESAEENERCEEYVRSCLDGAEKLARQGKFVVLRLWNLDEKGESDNNNEGFNARVMSMIEKYFPPEREKWVKTHRGERVATHIFVEWGERFQWPDINEKTDMPEDEGEYGQETCHALLKQVGILSDGTVVPCCLDRNGDIALGNIFEKELDSILSLPRAKAMKEGMAHHRFTEPLCYTCGFKRK